MKRFTRSLPSENGYDRSEEYAREVERRAERMKRAERAWELYKLEQEGRIVVLPRKEET